MNNLLRLNRRSARSLGGLLVAAGLLTAAAFGPPAFIDYQGRLVNTDGSPLAAEGALNYDVLFRIYDAESGGSLIWAEKQTVTVLNGMFSVRLGEGSAIPNSLGGGNEGSVDHNSPGLPGAFNGGDRYLSLTVPSLSSAAINPRLRFLSTPYSLVAGTATQLQQAPGTQSDLLVGSLAYATTELTSSAALDGTVANVLVNSTDNTVNATLPLSGSNKEMTFTKTDGSTNTVSVLPPAGGTINGGTAPISLAKQGDSVTLRNTGGNAWMVVDRYFGERVVVAAPNGMVNIPIVAGPVTSGTTSVVGSLGLILQNSETTAGGGAYNGVGLGFGRADETRQAIVGGSWGQDWLDFFTEGNFTNHRMRISSSGVTAVGTLSSSFRVSSSGAIVAAGGLPGAENVNNRGFTFAGNSGDSDSGMFSDADGTLKFTSNENTKLQVDTGGILVHGQATVTEGMAIGGGVNPDRRARLVVIGSANRDNGDFAFYARNGGNTSTGSSNGAANTGIYADNRVVSTEFNALSDARIKTIRGISNGGKDLETLMAVEVTDYLYRDTLAKGAVPQKKLIAQQVEKIFPQAVSKSTDSVPDIMKKAELKGGWILLGTDLQAGEKVRLLADKNVDQVCEVLEVKEGKFRAKLEATVGEVFVYGREVSDFRTVDYDAVAMLNVSATQQVKRDSDAAESALRRDNEALRAQVAAQDARIAALERENVARETRMAALEALVMKKADPSATVPVSVSADSASTSVR